MTLAQRLANRYITQFAQTTGIHLKPWCDMGAPHLEAWQAVAKLIEEIVAEERALDDNRNNADDKPDFAPIPPDAPRWAVKTGFNWLGRPLVQYDRVFYYTSQPKARRTIFTDKGIASACCRRLRRMGLKNVKLIRVKP